MEYESLLVKKTIFNYFNYTFISFTSNAVQIKSLSTFFVSLMYGKKSC